MFGSARSASASGGVADLPLAGEEHQDVARPLGDQLVDGVDDRADLVAVGIGVLVVGIDDRAVADLDRVGRGR